MRSQQDDDALRVELLSKTSTNVVNKTLAQKNGGKVPGKGAHRLPSSATDPALSQS